jgi:PAS domain S-box-containing protein
MGTNEKTPALRTLDADAVLRRIAEGTASATGEQFFRVLVRTLGEVLGTYGAWVTEYLPQERALRGLAFWADGQWVEGYYAQIDGTPCEVVVNEKRLVHYPDGLMKSFPKDPDFEKLYVESYVGVPLLDTANNVIGHLAVMDGKPLPDDPQMVNIFRIFASRATAELQRICAEREVREREGKLGRLVSGAMDAIIELDSALHVSQINPAAEKVFGCDGGCVMGHSFDSLLSTESGARFRALAEQLEAGPDGRRSQWLPGGLDAKRMDGGTFPAEATVSVTEDMGHRYYTVVLRNVNDRQEAERRIQSLTREREYLQEELREALAAREILGESPAIHRVLNDIRLVGATDSTVLILGETGTGKELIARAVHDASGRRERPLIKVNCAAIPAALMESEFFGHERGAFTGATDRREGRFALADGGTIFLDEIGDLPIDLQSKLLRILQEGEFEPVGSSKTRRVNVRVIAATNRDLSAASREGRFREDLYYRLNVFPVEVPPLRERGDDIIVLAEAFIQRFAQRMGRRVEGLTTECCARLKAYSWPGNVRELANVIERAVITAEDGCLNLDRALPRAGGTVGVADAPKLESGILTIAELQGLERASILRALDAAGWRVSGDGGAAKLLGLNPSTLSSRMKALGITRPKAT